MIPKRIQIKGFGPHIDTTLDFGEYASPLAIQASMGEGKTILIESIFAALYGRFLWYGGIYDTMTLGGIGKSSIGYDFSHASKEYRIDRRVSATEKTQTHTAKLFDLSSPTPNKPIAGPKIDDFNRAIEAMLGDWETAASTWFLSQSRTLDLAGQPGDPEVKARRRKLFHRFLGADVIAAHYDKTTAALDNVLRRAAELDAQMLDLPDYAAEIESWETSRTATKVKETEQQAKVGACQTRLAGNSNSLATLDSGTTHHKATIERYNLAKEKADAAAKSVKDLQDEIERLEGVAARGASAKADLASLDRLKVQREELRKQVALWDAWRDWETLRINAVKTVQIVGRGVREPELIGDETRTLAGTVDAVESEYRKARSDNWKAEQENSMRLCKRRSAENERNKYDHQVEEYQKRLDARADPLFGNNCKPCPYFADVQHLPDKLATAKNRARALQLELDEIPADKTLIDLDKIQQRGQAARDAAAKVEAFESTERIQAEHKKTLRKCKDQLSEHEDNEPPKPTTADPQGAKDQIQIAIDDLAGAGERVKQADVANSQLDEKDTALIDAKSQLHSANLDMGGISLGAKVARQAIADQDTARTKLSDEIAREEIELRGFTAELRRLTELIGHHGATIKGLEDRAAETLEKRERLVELRREANALGDVKKCFANNGVRQIIIDAAVPDLEDIANRLFQIATDGRMTFRIATQKALKKKPSMLAEDFSLLVRDDRGERDILRYSGGELHLNCIIVRIAVATWLGNLTGSRPETLVIDETFDRLGLEGTEALLKVLDNVGQQYEKLIVVTHDQNIADRMGSKIMLKKNIGGIVFLGTAEAAAAARAEEISFVESNGKSSWRV